ncbi:MAG: hypothetical protein RLZZ329_2376 [Pseudomonadota bacterium]
MKTKLTISGLALAIIGLLSSAAPLQAATDRSHAVATPAKEAQGIVQAMKRQFDKPQSPLKVAPVVVEGDWALAGWLQDARGGRALLQKRHGHWVIGDCGLWRRWFATGRCTGAHRHDRRHGHCTGEKAECGRKPTASRHLEAVCFFRGHVARGRRCGSWRGPWGARGVQHKH